MTMKPWALAWAILPLTAAFAQPQSASPTDARLCQPYGGMPAAFGAALSGRPNVAGMVALPGGVFRMGSDQGYPEERHVHPVRLAPFLIDRHEVTNAQFAAFVKATAYVTLAERGHRVGADGKRSPFPAGGVVFVWPKNGEQLRGAYQWWRYKAGANWRHPYGPESAIEGRDNHPVVQIAYEDALAYAAWLGRDLPTEAEAEYAARGGLDGNTYAWGNTPEINGRSMANAWQGAFPYADTGQDGHSGTAPVGCYQANGYGLFDTVGNTWEWTRDRYADRHSLESADNPMVVRVAGQGLGDSGSRVIKGGSFLCAPDFCLRYRPSSRQPQDPTLSTVHLGFRTVFRPSRKN